MSHFPELSSASIIPLTLDKCDVWAYLHYAAVVPLGKFAS